MNTDMTSPSSLLEEILISPEDAATDRRANDLLREIFHGYSIENIRVLLQDSREPVVYTGIWIASEAGQLSSSILDDALRLLWSTSKRIRFWALDTLIWASPERADALAKGLLLLSDFESSVRWKATDFAVRATELQLLATLAIFDSQPMNAAMADGVRLLLDHHTTASIHTLNALDSDDQISVRFGLVSAVRNRAVHPNLLTAAASNGEREVSAIANEWLRKR